MALFVLLGLLALTSSAVANKKGSNCYLLQEGACRSKIDLSIILDGSGSVKEENFKSILNVLANEFFPRFVIGQKETRVQLLVYSGSTYQELEYGLSDYDNLKDLQDATLAASYPNSVTFTGPAMKKAREQFEQDMRTDKEVKKFNLVMTDGETDETDKIVFDEGIKWAKIAKVVGVAMGPDVRPYQECGSEEAETNYPGNNIRTDSANTIDDCESLCETTNLCRGFVYNSIDKECDLKSAMENGASAPPGYTAKRCSPGVSEIVQGNRDSVIILKEIDKLSEQLDVIVQAVCQDEVPNYNCEECRCKAISHWIYDSKSYLPECDETDNSFKPKQCNQGSCFCVDKYGIEISGTRTSEGREALECSSEGDKAEKECTKKAKAPTEFFKAECDDQGNFKPVQCMTGPTGVKMCWCSLANGGLIPDTVHSPVVGPTPDCRRHINLSYDCKGEEGLFTHPFDINRFIHCKAGGAYACACQAGLKFNPYDKVCAETTEAPEK